MLCVCQTKMNRNKSSNFRKSYHNCQLVNNNKELHKNDQDIHNVLVWFLTVDG